MLLPAWISASRRRVRGGSANGFTVRSHAWFSGASTDRRECEPVCEKDKQKPEFGWHGRGRHTGSSMSGCSTDGLKRVYNWLPNTAADTSKPEPTLPWARQCTNCATLCAKCRDEALASWSGAIKPVWMSRAVTREVMSAAEEPSPVLATFASATPVGLNGGICASEASSTCKPRLLSCRFKTEVDGQSEVHALSEKGYDACLVLLRVKVVISNDCDVEAIIQCP